MIGQVARIVADKGFGFIRGEDGIERFFHRSGMLRNSPFEMLREGQHVNFEVEDSVKGPRATNVSVVNA